MEFVNLTPHSVVIIQKGQVIREYAPSGKVARLEEWDASVPGSFELDGVPVVRKMYGNIQIISREEFLDKKANPVIHPLPAEEDGVAYIVPMLVGQQLAGQRDDLFGPDYGIGGVRTADGKVSGAVGFIKY